MIYQKKFFVLSVAIIFLNSGCLSPSTNLASVGAASSSAARGVSPSPGPSSSSSHSSTLWPSTVLDSVATGTLVVTTNMTASLAGNVYVVGYTTGSIDGQTFVGKSMFNYFLTKYNSVGAREWTVQDGSSSGSTNLSGTSVYGGVALNSDENIYVAGFTTGAIDGQTLHGSYDYFLTKYNASGILQWTVEAGPAGGSALAYGVSVDSSGNAYVTGTTTGTVNGQPARRSFFWPSIVQTEFSCGR